MTAIIALALLSSVALAQPGTTTSVSKSAAINSADQSTWPGTSISVDITDPDTGVKKTYKIEISGASLWDFGYQAGQYVRYAATTQDLLYNAIPSCLVAPSAVPAGGQPSPVSVVLLDWTQARLVDASGALYSVVDATGSAYRNGLRMATASVRRLCLYGSDVYGQGRTSGSWYVWRCQSLCGTGSATWAWAALPADLEPGIFAAATAAPTAAAVKTATPK
jgi:hypothetical protein